VVLANHLGARFQRYQSAFGQTLFKVAALAGLFCPSFALSQTTSTQEQAEAVAQTIIYSLAPKFRDNQLAALTITMTFEGDEDGETRLVLPNQWSGQDDLVRHLKAINVQGGSASSPSPDIRLILHAPKAQLRVTYDVETSIENDPTSNQDQGSLYRPIIRPTWFSFVGEAVFAQVDDDIDRLARFTWQGFPAAWQIVSDLDHQALNVNDIMESTALGGQDVRLVSTTNATASPLRLGIRGQFGIGDEAIAAMVGKIEQTELAFWGDTPNSYAITIVPLTSDASTQVVGGTGRRDGLALWATTNVKTPSMVRLLAHEYFHNWMPNRLGDLPRGDDERLDYWISEGFTDYYTFRLLLKSGLWTPEDFVAAWNEVLFKHNTSKARNEPNSTIRAEFWSDQTIRDLAYRRGAIVAAIMDMRVRVATNGTKSLDHIVRNMKNMPRSSMPQIRNRLIAAARTEANVDLMDVITTVVETGGDALFPTQNWGQCLVVSPVQVHAFDVGFDEDASVANGNIITGVDPTGNAFASGFRDGMTLLGWRGGVIGDPNSQIAYDVSDNGRTRDLRWLPKSTALYTSQKISLGPGFGLTATPEVRSACMKMLAGD
jgi:predicted metalloprotease with PDZ domain